MTSSLSPQDIRKLGIVVGKGDLPGKLITLCQNQNIPFFLLALEHQTPPDVVVHHPHRWVRIGALAQALSFLQEAEVSHVVLAGAIQRPSLLDLRPDLKASQVLARIGMKAFGDDGLLSAIVSVIEEEGMVVLGPHQLLESLTVSTLSLGRSLSDQEQSDIQRGLQVLDALSHLDVGQAVVVQEGIVLAIEAAEGTDGMLERCVSARSRISGLGKGGVLVKLSKVSQELRVDMPTIGLRTLHKVWDAGLSGLAIEANRVIVLDRPEVEDFIREKDLFLQSISRQGKAVS